MWTKIEKQTSQCGQGNVLPITSSERRVFSGVGSVDALALENISILRVISVTPSN